MKTVCITGAAGNLGSLLARYLLEKADLRLHLMCHRKPPPDGLEHSSRVAVFKCDLGKIETFEKCLEGTDDVVHFAGVLFKAGPEKFLPITNTGYFSKLISACKRSGVKRIILISFPHVEGNTDPLHPATDRTDRVPVSVHAQTRLQEEILLKTQFPDGVILRAGMVYGKGILMPDAARWLARRWLLGVWKTPTCIHLISKDDFCEAVKNCLLLQSASGTYNLGDEGKQTLQEYLDFACSVWKCKKPWRMPLWLIYFAAVVSELISRVFRVKSPLTKDFIDIGRVSYYADTSRMKKDLLPVLKHPTMKEGAVIF